MLNAEHLIWGADSSDEPLGGHRTGGAGPAFVPGGWQGSAPWEHAQKGQTRSVASRTHSVISATCIRWHSRTQAQFDKLPVRYNTLRYVFRYSSNATVLHILQSLACRKLGLHWTAGLLWTIMWKMFKWLVLYCKSSIWASFEFS